LKGRAGCDFSFSGLKTAVRETAEDLGELTDQDKADICASFQSAVADTMRDRLKRAFQMFRAETGLASAMLVVAGGVAANRVLRTLFEVTAREHGFELSVPPFHLCTDNAAMIGWAAAERLALGLTDTQAAAVRPRWPLDIVSVPAYGSGRMGAKA
jgi:N6-L-threonylcarbamoyladenine synthase